MSKPKTPPAYLYGLTGSEIEKMSVGQHSALFANALKDAGLPPPTRELEFAKESMGRKWRFDFAFEDSKTAVEIEGGSFAGGRHTRGQGFAQDMEKYNAAIFLGWAVLRYNRKQALTKAAIEQIRAVHCKRGGVIRTVDSPEMPS